MAKFEPGTKVRVVEYGDPDDPHEVPSIVGEEGTVLEPRGPGPSYHTVVTFTLPDLRNGEWLFLDDEIEAV
jgi:hypothetical protein